MIKTIPLWGQISQPTYYIILISALRFDSSWAVPGAGEEALQGHDQALVRPQVVDAETPFTVHSPPKLDFAKSGEIREPP